MIYISDTKLSMGSPWKKDPKVAGNTQSVIQSHCSTELLTSEAHINLWKLQEELHSGYQMEVLS